MQKIDEAPIAPRLSIELWTFAYRIYAFKSNDVRMSRSVHRFVDPIRDCDK